MARQPKFTGKCLQHVVSLLRQYGPTVTRKILAAPVKAFGKPHKLGCKRDAKLFPQPVSVCMPTLCTIAATAEIEFKRGRKNPIVGKAREQYVARLVRDHGSPRAVEILANGERDKRLFPEPVAVSAPTLQHIAKRYGVKLHRGRRPLKAAA